MKQETLKEAIKKHLYAKAFLSDPNNTGFVDRFIEHTKAAEWGAEWQRNHVWHNVLQSPSDGEMVIAMLEVGPLVCGPNHNDWKQTVDESGIIAWAYFKDLMPTSFDEIIEANKDVLQRLRDK